MIDQAVWEKSNDLAATIKAFDAVITEALQTA
jgi:hypothetical protein